MRKLDFQDWSKHLMRYLQEKDGRKFLCRKYEADF
jgi:hypothetical protein